MLKIREEGKVSMNAVWMEESAFLIDWIVGEKRLDSRIGLGNLTEEWFLLRIR